MKTGILFDLDGTLLNTLEDLKDAVNHALRQHGCPERTLEEIRHFVGNGARLLIKRALPQGTSEETVDQVLADYQAYYATHSQVKTGPYEGIMDALKEIGAKYPIAIVSNKHDPAVQPLCADYFPGIYALGEIPGCPRKPAPDMLRKAMNAIGADTCIYVGDSEVDVITARNTGVKCLSVLWGFRDKADMEAEGGQYFCDHPSQLLSKLEEMM